MKTRWSVLCSREDTIGGLIAQNNFCQETLFKYKEATVQKLNNNVLVMLSVWCSIYHVCIVSLLFCIVKSMVLTLVDCPDRVFLTPPNAIRDIKRIKRNAFKTYTSVRGGYCHANLHFTTTVKQILLYCNGGRLEFNFRVCNKDLAGKAGRRQMTVILAVGATFFYSGCYV